MKANRDIGRRLEGEWRGGGWSEGTEKVGRGRENNNDSLTTRACEKTAVGKSVSDHLPAGMHDFIFLKAAALQKGSCLVSTATKAQPRLYLCAWNVPVCTGAAPQRLTLCSFHQAMEHGTKRSQTSPLDKEAKQCCNN